MKRIRARKNVGGGVDRISQLPEPIIHRIMSRLSPKEVVRTSVLSRTWYHFKASYPVLKFNEMHFGDEEHHTNLDKFRQVIYNSLNHFCRNKLALVAFHIDIFSPSLSSDLDSWIRLALENKVKSLHLCVRTESILSVPPTKLSILPQPLFSSKTLTNIKLTMCCLKQPLSIFSSIRKLSLVNCRLKEPIFLKNDDCSFLEHLVLKYCYGFKSVHISNLRRLRTVDVSYCFFSFELVVASQSIQTMYIYARALSKPWSIINIDGCHHLKFLYLQSGTITDKELQSLLSKLTLIEELYLYHCQQLETIYISNPCLKTLLFVCLFHSPLRIIEIAAPSLKNFMYMADSRVCRIKVTGCCNLKTLVLKKYMGPETTFHDLLSKCPLLENLWMVQCAELERLELLNPRLKRLHLVTCSKLNSVKVDSPNLFEFCCTGLKATTIPGVGGARSEYERSSHWYYRLKEVLVHSVGLDFDNLTDLF
ncbi:hypothetical protein SLA2020_209770 [Shorea laevis]